MAILFGWSNGSEPEVIALSKKVGFLIDAEENIHYGIIQGVKGLERDRKSVV